MCEQDVAQLDVLIYEDALFTLPMGQTITKAEDLATYQAGHLVVRHAHASQQQIHLIGPTVVVAVTIELQGKYLGRPFAGMYRYVRVWQQQQETWQIIAGNGVALSR